MTRGGWPRATRWAARYAAAARAMPLEPFARACVELRYDPLALARQFDQPLMSVFVRMASLPPAQFGAQVAGLVICDGAGALTFRKPVEGFAVPRFSAACPLWPLYAALSRPGTSRRDLVEMAGSGGNCPSCPITPDARGFDSAACFRR